MVEPVSTNSAEDEPQRQDADASSRQETPGSGEGRRRAKPKKKRSFWKELPILIVVALLLTFLIQQFLARVYMIPSGSMETTLHGCPGCTDDRVMVDKLVYDFSDPEPGEVVVFKGPESWTENDIELRESSNGVAKFFQTIGSVVGLAPPDERDFVKRIIATGGQTVQGDEQGRVIVNGKVLDEPYVHWEGGQPNEDQAFGPVTVPDGTVWVMGDNRNNSLDSRRQGTGPDGKAVPRGAVPVDNIIGKARLIVLPPSRWSTIDAPNPQTNAQPVALGAADWQSGLPLGVGVLVAWPTVLAGRKVGSGVRKVVDRRR